MKVAKTKWKQNIMSDCIKTVKVKDAVQKKITNDTVNIR